MAGLKEQGKFMGDKYTIYHPLGDVTVQMKWEGSTVHLKVLKKPFFVPSGIVWDKIDERIAQENEKG